MNHRSSRIGFCSVALVLACTSSLPAEAQLAGYVARPSCGPAAVSVWLALAGRDVRVSDIEIAFQDVGVRNPHDSVSVADVVAAMKRIGAEAELVRWPSRRLGLALMALPCIVNLNRTEDRVGHFSVLAKVDGEHVWLLDATQDSLLQEQTLDSFLAEWEGITIGSRGVARSFAFSLTILFGGVAVLGFVLLRMRKTGAKRPRLSATPIFLAACTLCHFGCGGPRPTTAVSPPLKFASPSCNLGVVRELGQRTQPFDFEVTSSVPVKIKEISPCCGSRLEDRTIIGRELSPGSKHSISLVVDVRDDSTPSSVFARIETKPASPVPLVVAVHHQFIGKPRLSSGEIRLATTPGSLAETSLEAFHWRRPTDPSVSLLRDKCESAVLRIGSVDVTTELVQRSGTQLAFDTTRIKLTMASHRAVTSVKGALRLCWSDGATHDVPVTIRVCPPVRTEPDRVFFGYVDPGSISELTIPVRKSEGIVFEILELQSTDAAVVATYDARRESLRIRLQAPSSPGRFESEIRITFRSSNLPEIRLPVSAIVREQVRDTNRARH